MWNTIRHAFVSWSLSWHRNCNAVALKRYNHNPNYWFTCRVTVCYRHDRRDKDKRIPGRVLFYPRWECRRCRRDGKQEASYSPIYDLITGIVCIANFNICLPVTCLYIISYARHIIILSLMNPCLWLNGWLEISKSSYQFFMDIVNT